MFAVASLLGGFAFAQATSRCSKERLAQEAKASDFVAIVSVKRVFSPPGYWSGMFAAMQLVEYVPIELLKGKLDQTSIVVSHYVVSNSSMADTKRPQLSPDLFRPGHRVIAFLDRGSGQFWIEASGCKSQANKTCVRVANDEEHQSLAEAAKNEPQPSYTVKDENCGVLSADPEQIRTIKTLLRVGPLESQSQR
jgi:hypothetical protein